MTIHCTIVPVTAYQQNCSIIKCDASGRGAIVDPGGDVDRILKAVESMDAKIDKIILTHAHLDHCAASDVLRKTLNVPIEGPHQDDQFWLDQLPEACKLSGFPHADSFLPDRWLKQGDTVTVGKAPLKVFHCPGHTPGHVVFLYEKQNVAWVGDVLFQGSIGRTDFPRGNHEQLITSIRETLFPLGDDITFIPGHGPTSTFGQERLSNPYVADSRYG
ncbi:MAG: MBL fold metallo-hydrolase [Pseudomonadota bacterium]